MDEFDHKGYQPQEHNFQTPPEQPPTAQQEYQWSYSDYASPEQPKKKRSGLAVFSVVVSIVLLITVAGFTAAMVMVVRRQQSLVDSSSRGGYSESAPSLNINGTPALDSDASVSGEELTTVQIAAKVRPSVVGVVCYQRKSGTQASSQGSGIIMSSDGLIITNAHVVDGADGIKVVLDNEEEYTASLVGIDTKTDLAVVRISKENLTPAEFGDSSVLMVGERVIAIGNPGGLVLSGSVTQGIVSALDRTVNISDGAGYSLKCIQTDAAINPGNSGGALVNRFGQVIGINSAKIITSGYEGVGFAISITDAKPVIDNLIRYGYVKDRVKIGITLSPIDEVLSKLYKIPVGLRVISTEEDSDAAAKGLQAGDIITQIDGKDVKQSEDVAQILETKKPGDTIIMKIYRQTANGVGDTFDLEVALSEDAGD